MKADLDLWLPRPSLRVAHRRESTATPERLWECAREIRVRDAGLLGRLIRWRIPGVPADISFDQMFRQPPFIVLDDNQDWALVCGLVGRIWTLRRDYPKLSDPQEFKSWADRGTVRVLFANWVQRAGQERAVLASETRVQSFGPQGRLGLAAVRPLVSSFQHLVGTDGIEAAVAMAERR